MNCASASSYGFHKSINISNKSTTPVLILESINDSTMTKVLDCDLRVSEFELQSLLDLYLNHTHPPVMG